MEAKYNPLPADVILMRNEETGCYLKVKEYVLSSEWDKNGEWGHVAMFCTWTKEGVPLVVESIGRGVMLRPLSCSNGRYVKVLRHEDQNLAMTAASRALQLSSDPEAGYGYVDIPFAVLPRLLVYKITGKRYRIVYRHNHIFICSEVPDEAFGYVFFPDDLEPPLPGDYNMVKQLHPEQPAFEGILNV